MSAIGRDWFRLTIREMLLIVTIVALVCGLIAVGPHYRHLRIQARQEQRRPRLEYHLVRQARNYNLNKELRGFLRSEVDGRSIEDHHIGILAPDAVGFNRSFQVSTRRGEKTPVVVFEAAVRWAIPHVWPDEVGQSMVDLHTPPLIAKYKEVTSRKEVDEVVETAAKLGIMRTTLQSSKNSSRLTVNIAFVPSEDRLASLGVEDPELLNVPYHFLGSKGWPDSVFTLD